MMINSFRIFTGLLLFCSLVATSCAGYAGDVVEIRTALNAGDKDKALSEANKALEVKEQDQYPEKIRSKNALLILERASIKQGLELYKSSTLDFRVADQNLELLDIKNATVGNISKWIFSGNSGAYKAPSHEKLLLNTMNMLNYLALSNLESARVEARRVGIMQAYLKDEKSEKDAVLGIGNYLSGFTYEMSGRYEQAFQQYAIAYQSGQYPSLENVLKKLSGCTNYRTAEISKILGEEAGVPSTDPCTEYEKKTGTILIVPAVGLAPYKIPKRIPIGAAIVLAGAFLAPAQVSQANGFAVKGMLKWVNFPQLTQTKPKYNQVQVSVDGRPVPSEYGEHVSGVVKKSWDSIKGKLMAAAIVRMIARAVAGAATNQAVKSGSGESWAGLLAQVIVEGAMTAADTPDTRSWVTLPDSLFLTRVELPAGKHTVTTTFTGSAGTKTVSNEIEIAPGGFKVIPIETMR